MNLENILSYKLFEDTNILDNDIIFNLNSLLLNVDIFKPELIDLTEISVLDPLYHDVSDQFQKALSEFEEKEEELKFSQIFTEILLHFKNKLKILFEIFERVNFERKQFRETNLQLIKQILRWKREGNFYKKNEPQVLSSILLERGYELVKRARDRYEKISLEKDKKILKLEKQLEKAKRSNRVYQKRLKKSEAQLKDVLKCDQSCKKILISILRQCFPYFFQKRNTESYFGSVRTTKDKFRTYYYFW